MHVKTESLLKANFPVSWEEIIHRPIMAHSTAVTSMFSPIYMELKRRLKTLLRPNIMYTDGKTPYEI